MAGNWRDMAARSLTSHPGAGPALLDRLPQGAVVPGSARPPTCVAIRPELTRRLRAFCDRTGFSPGRVGLAAWVIVVDRVVGDQRVDVALNRVGRGVGVTTEAAGSAMQWIASFGQLASEASSDCANAESMWLDDPRQPPAAALRCPVSLGVDSAAEWLVAHVGELPLAEEGLQSLLESMAHVIERLVDAPEAPIASIRAVSTIDTQRCLDWNSASSGHSGSRSVVDRFLDMVRRLPAARALAWNGGHMNYAELAAES
jgi:hypothetical protein